MHQLYINTIGCQMNVYDSDQIERALAPNGFARTDQLEEADLVIVNTCAIRAKAEQKAFSFVGRLAQLKQRKPGLIVGVGGCVAQQEGEKILARAPQVDLVFGPKAIPRLARLVERVRAKRLRVVDIEDSDGIEELDLSSGFRDDGQVARFVTVMQGCDNFCTYCVVPYVRGREASRHPDKILEEIRVLADGGVREVTLLGQNVNSYGRKENLGTFAELLARVNRIDGLARIRFTTSHPKDLSDGLIDAFGRLDKLCPHIHLPVQSGSDRVLKRMNRKYTRAVYLDRIARLRHVRPDMAITTDFIVGFPGETEEDFEETLGLLETVKFDGVFAFMYSDRSVAPASGFEGKIDEAQKKERLQRLLQQQEVFTLSSNRALIGCEQEVLVEGFSTRPGLAEENVSPRQWSGRTPGNKIVNFNPDPDCAGGDAVRPGLLVGVRIEKAYSHSLWGRPVRVEEEPGGYKGDTCHAA
ncbi:MAG: tRNA (N6-isopentenyl adenosine(37)-C2)-methylthiotransferase MiaB [Desulfobacterales bacterium]|nr:tRNA (N6-isopentenyl adenosine(37)-C2)-methylthiotransferase MiaB [Desulfobacterales bacterium]